MFLGHYLSWICAGIMGAAAATVLKKSLIELDSGSVATTALGTLGALTVVVAGWTTANPMLYRSGLAFQVVSPGWPRWRVTLIAGLITTLFACSPFVFTKMLDFVVVYGLILLPMGAIVVAEHWLFPLLGWNRYWASRKGLLFNWPAMIAWIGSVACGLTASYLGLIHLFFVFIPVWIIAMVAYVVLAGRYGARGELPEDADEQATASHHTAAGSVAKTPSTAENRLYLASAVAATLSLAACLVVPAWIMASGRTESRMSVFGVVAGLATVVYFISSVYWLAENEKRRTSIS
jgi:NCS1 family nucleobase:cation symporter-1